METYSEIKKGHILKQRRDNNKQERHEYLKQQYANNPLLDKIKVTLHGYSLIALSQEDIEFILQSTTQKEHQ